MISFFDCMFACFIIQTFLCLVCRDSVGVKRHGYDKLALRIEHITIVNGFHVFVYGFLLLFSFSPPDSIV